MTREFPDELLSAFLDGELSPAEHEQVERHLAASATDRQLLSELKSIRSEVAALPPAVVSPDFADRVVRAAVAEAEKHNTAAAVTSLPSRGASWLGRRVWVRAAVASAAALAACLLLVVQSWRKSDSPVSPGIAIDPGKTATPIVVASDELLKALYAAAPAEGEAVVLRLRVPKELPIADALSAAVEKAGLTSLAANTPTGAAAIASVYGKALEAKYGPVVPGSDNQALLNGTVAAAQALFIEAPLEQLQAIVKNIGDSLKQPLKLDAESRLAFNRPALPQGEGEFSPSTKSNRVLVAGQPFAQQLNAAAFRLEKKLAQAATTAAQSPAATPDPKQIVRVLLLVEVE